MKVEGRVDLGRCDIGMSQEFLDAAQVSARLQQVAGEGVTQDMGVQAHGGAARSTEGFDAGLHGPGGESAPPGRQKQGIGVGPGMGLDKLGADLQPAQQRLGRDPANGNRARLVAFAQDGRFTLAQVDPAFGALAAPIAPGTVQGDQFRQAQAAGIEQFCDGVVAQRQKFRA